MNTKNITTILDLKLTALDAAKQCIDTNNQRKDDLAVASIQLEAFNAAGHDRADFGTWQGFANAFVADLISWRSTLSPSAQAAKAAAQTAD